MSSTESWPNIRINSRATDRIHSGHPWVFVSDVLDGGDASAGDVVRVLDPKGRTLGTAHFSNTSQIALRLLSRRIEQIDKGFFVRRIETALTFRKQVVQQSEAYRLVHAEGDLLPGLIVDRYADWLVVQFLDQGMDRMTPLLIEALSKVLSPKGIVARNDAASRAKENLPQESKVLFGELPAKLAFSMNGMRWHADLLGGQKPACSWISVKTIWRPPAMLTATRWIVLAARVALQFTWHTLAAPLTL